MKRSSLKRGSGLQRKTPLVRTWIERSKRTISTVTDAKNRITRRVGLKVNRKSISKSAELSRQVRANAEGICQRCGLQGHHAHHRCPRSRRPDLVHEISNLVWTCWKCHSWIHDHPNEATAEGWLSTESYEIAHKESLEIVNFIQEKPA